MDGVKRGTPDPRQLRVGDAMQLHVVSVVPEMTVRELAQVLLENGITGAPVLDRRGKVIGVVSMTDVLQLAAHEAEIPAGQVAWAPVPAAEEVDDGLVAAAPAVSFSAPAPDALAEAAFDAYQVRDIMTPAAFAVRPGDTLAEAVGFLLRGRIHRALVVEDGVLHGIITPFDVLETLGWE